MDESLSIDPDHSGIKRGDISFIFWTHLIAPQMSVKISRNIHEKQQQQYNDDVKRISHKCRAKNIHFNVNLPKPNPIRMCYKWLVFFVYSELLAHIQWHYPASATCKDGTAWIAIAFLVRY